MLIWNHEGSDDNDCPILSADSGSYSARVGFGGATIEFTGQAATPSVQILLDEFWSNAPYEDRYDEMRNWVEERLAHFAKRGHTAADIYQSIFLTANGDQLAWQCGCNTADWTECPVCSARYNDMFATPAQLATNV